MEDDSARTYTFPLDFYLTKGWRSISDAAHRFETMMRREVITERDKEAARADMLLDEAEARECYRIARELGWTGDADAKIAADWATYLPQVSAEDILKVRAKAEAERETRGASLILS
jgi:hypothetical protein